METVSVDERSSQSFTAEQGFSASQLCGPMHTQRGIVTPGDGQNQGQGCSSTPCSPGDGSTSGHGPQHQLEQSRGCWEAGERGDPGWDAVMRRVRLRHGPGEKATAALSGRVTVMELLKVREKPSSNPLLPTSP